MPRRLLISLALLPALAPAQDKPKAQDIIQTAIAAGQFKTLAAALGSAGLVDTLRGAGPFTVFAPTDEAFAKLPAGTVESLLEPANRAKLTAILTYHVLPGRVDAAAAIGAGRAKTLQGETVQATISGGQLKINDARVIANDVAASNGIIHIIDSVLLPEVASQPAPLTRSQVLAKVILDAIDTGVPLFNHNQQGACAAIYRLAAFAVLNLGRDELTAPTEKLLETALGKAAANDAESAWILRRALDQTLEALLRVSESEAGTKPENVEKRTSRMATKDLFAFDSARSLWRAVNDDVMGGISKGRMSFDPGTQLATFAGQLSMENNGGFASVRSSDRDLDLRGYDGLVLRVRGDGRTYKIRATGTDTRGGYQAEFTTENGVWQELRVPFADLRYSFRGRNSENDRIEGKEVRGLGLLIADKNEAPFALEIDWIKAYRAVTVSDEN